MDPGNPDSLPVTVTVASPFVSATGASVSVGAAFTFLDFPPEIRNLIYKGALGWPDSLGDCYRGYYRWATAYSRSKREEEDKQDKQDKQEEDKVNKKTNKNNTTTELGPKGDLHRVSGHHQRRSRHPLLTTPTILLLCKKITAECQPLLEERQLVIDRLPPCMRQWSDSCGRSGGGGFLKLSNFIGRATLQSLRRIDLRIGLGEGMGSGWAWQRVVDELLRVLRAANSLVHLRLLIRRCNQDNRIVWRSESKEEHIIKQKITRFRTANPNVSNPARVTVEIWQIKAQSAVLVSTDEEPQVAVASPPPQREYPDPEMFPNSIMQFVFGTRP